MNALNGVILQASYRIVTRQGGRRVPVVHLYGRLEDSRTFLVRDDRQQPHFYVHTADAARVHGAEGPAPTSKCDFSGAPVSRVGVTIPSDVPALRDRLHANGIDTFEADVRFPVRYLIERGIKGACVIEGTGFPGADAGVGVSLIFDNPQLRPAQVKVEPRVLSFDIETDPKAERLLAISLYGTNLDEVLIVDGSGRTMPDKAICCVDERAALTAFCDRVREFDPDVFTGWNTIDFDFTVLQRIATRLRHPFILGRDAGEIRIRRAEGYFGSGQATIPGRLVLDGIDLLRGAFVRMEDYSLDAVAREVLGEGKAIESNARDRLAEIIHNYRHNLPAFALYARTDARLAYDIVSRLDLIRLAFARSQLAGMTPDRVAASIASFDFVYLSELEKRDIVAPTVRSDDSRVFAAQQGGHVLEPVTGLHRNVWVFDFKSLYPNIIRTFNIDPLSYVAEPRAGDDLISTPGGAFRRVPAILPGLLDDLFPRREAAKRAGDAVAAQSIKILMNSFYGVLGTSACRFYNPALANSITGSGKEILLWSKRWFEEAGFRVLYGDTDSLFVGSGSSTAPPPQQGLQLAAELNEQLTRYIRERWGVLSRLELEFEKTYLRLLLPQARHSTRGASKRYAGLLRTGDISHVEFVGMEVVRSDWTALAKQVQRELYQRLFTDQPVDVYLSDIVKTVREGALDNLLVYRKSLRKGAATYTATTPPHVAAARKSPQSAGSGLGRKVIEYVVTTGGPEPTDNIQHPPDREHYVTKQVRPVAEPVLATLGLDFDTVIGDGRQAELPF
ncbi:MAG TPA: DNA polymerase II [Steroidobacteraceae bacterium]|nr:DNA polymerase II [Steroidobacteraceae bacterium]